MQSIIDPSQANETSNCIWMEVTKGLGSYTVCFLYPRFSYDQVS